MPVAEIKDLKNFDFRKQLAFAYLTSERFLPNYVFFSEQFNFGSSDVFNEGLGFIYDSLMAEKQVNVKEIDALLERLKNNLPNTNNFATAYATIALYCGGIVYESVNLLKKQDIGRILDDISDLAINTIDCFIQERDDMDYDDIKFEEKIQNDSLMKQEMTIQKGIISYLSKINHIDHNDISTLAGLSLQLRPVNS